MSKRISLEEYEKLYQEKAVVKGIDAMKVFVEQLPREYEEIVKLYPNGKVFAWGKERDIRSFYYSWLVDRAMHGLNNTVEQFVGLNYDKLTEVTRNDDNWENEISKYDGVSQTLTKSWKAWDLVKFIYGYERFKDWGGEQEMQGYGLPLAFKAFGIPLSGIQASPYIVGAGGGEWAVPLPDDIMETLKQAFPNARLAIGYGNIISMYSCIDGQEKDGRNQIFQYINQKGPIYLWKK
jgi:hypothetical protein